MFKFTLGFLTGIFGLFGALAILIAGIALGQESERESQKGPSNMPPPPPPA